MYKEQSWLVLSNSKKKVRGIKRRCRSFSRFLSERTSAFPIDNTNKGASHVITSFDHFFKVPKRRNHTPLRRFYAQYFVNQVQQLIDQKTDAQEEKRIFCVLSLPKLDLSAIIKIFTKRGLERFYDGLFYRNEEYKMVEPLPPVHSIENEWGLYIPEGLQIKRYKITSYSGQEVWLIGNLE